MRETKPESGHMPIADRTQATKIEQVFVINSDPGRAERLRKEYLFGKGPRTLRSHLTGIVNSIRKTNDRIDALEDRLKELDGISMPRHIPRPPSIAEYHIERFLPDE